MFAPKGRDETVRVSNNYRQKHLSKLVRVSNNYRKKQWHGFIFTRDIILRTTKAAFGSQVWCRIFVGTRFLRYSFPSDSSEHRKGE